MGDASDLTPVLPQRRRRWRRCALWLLAGVCAWYGLGRVTSPLCAVSVEDLGAPVQSEQAGGALRVACYNIAHGRGAETDRSNWGAEDRDERVDAIAAMLVREKVDLVVLNEADIDATWSGRRHQARAIAEATGLRYLATQCNVDASLPGVSWRFGNAILSRYPIVDAEIVRLPAYSRFERVFAGNHDVLVAVVRLPDDTLLDVWAIHLESRDAPTRRRAAQRILAAVEASPRPALLAGDFNSSPSDPSSASEPTAIDLFLRSGKFRVFPEATAEDRLATFPSLPPTRTIDWIVAPSSWRIRDAAVQPDALSDHLAVVATLEFAQEPGDSGESPSRRE